MTKRFNSHVTLKAEHREQLVDLLNVLTCTTLDLTYQVKQAHWNIKGPQFFARHELFDKLATRLRNFTDDLAERASTLGGYAEGTVRLAAEKSALPEYDLKAIEGRTHIRALVERYDTFTATVRTGIETARKLEDPATEDLLIEILRGSELDMWFLESHINV